MNLASKSTFRERRRRNSVKYKPETESRYACFFNDAETGPLSQSRALLAECRHLIVQGQWQNLDFVTAIPPQDSCCLIALSNRLLPPSRSVSGSYPLGTFFGSPRHV
jgi:hypothetical protein